ncbi:Uncharacterised protein [Moraxella caviae]|nr:hypothetical protein [Moraxella caviae]STZ13572.1 Uncharacterised protein [Moraxella caviae]
MTDHNQVSLNKTIVDFLNTAFDHRMEKLFDSDEELHERQVTDAIGCYPVIGGGDRCKVDVMLNVI